MRRQRKTSEMRRQETSEVNAQLDCASDVAEVGFEPPAAPSVQDEADFSLQQQHLREVLHPKHLRFSVEEVLSREIRHIAFERISLKMLAKLEKVAHLAQELLVALKED